MEKWMIYGKKADFNRISKRFGISPMSARILRNRDVITDEEIEEYLNGSIDNMYSPWLFKDMDRAVDLIKIKIIQGNKIRIICDYDIDGICSGFILLDSLEKLGANVSIAVPDRIEDGYGINESIIQKAIDDKVDTIITCDNGIAAYNQIEYAKERGLTIIITDHHEVPFEENENGKEYIVPNADAVINQKQHDCGYPFKELCGAAVAYKFICALYEVMGYDNTETYPLLEYVAIATVGDIVELKGENRIIVKYGLELLKKTDNVGLNQLINLCGIEKGKISTYHIGFVIGPCLNASGRLSTATKAIKLLREKNEEKAKILANDLYELNIERKQMTEDETKKAIEIAKEYEQDKVLVVYLKDCHESIAGIIAGRVRERYNKPTFVLTKTKEGVKGSGRSIEEYDMYNALNQVKDLLTKFGGHKMAAGVSLDEERVDEFRQRLNEKSALTEEDLNLKVWIDMQLPIKYVTRQFVEELERLQPFGKGNEKPVFADKELKVKSLKIMGKQGNVIKMELEDSDKYVISGIIFNRAQEFMNFITEKFGQDEVKKAMRGVNNEIDFMATFYPTINEFNGKSTLQIVIDRFC